MDPATATPATPTTPAPTPLHRSHHDEVPILIFILIATITTMMVLTIYSTVRPVGSTSAIVISGVCLGAVLGTIYLSYVFLCLEPARPPIQG
jgi:quinol-cytochrome oxidoreductase complex cytochrome b subunit